MRPPSSSPEGEGKSLTPSPSPKGEGSRVKAIRMAFLTFHFSLFTFHFSLFHVTIIIRIASSHRPDCLHLFQGQEEPRAYMAVGEGSYLWLRVSLRCRHACHTIVCSLDDDARSREHHLRFALAVVPWSCHS